MKITKEILQRYLKGDCSDTEIEFIHRNIHKIKEQEDALFPEQEWVDADNLSEYPNAEQVKQAIVDYIKQPKHTLRIQRRRLMFRWAMVASIVLLISAVFYFSRTNTAYPVEEDMVQLEIPTPDSRNNLYYINSGKDVMQITAADGSVIALYPKSEIKFSEHFDSLVTRDFFLKGKAKFSVAKNEDKPFNVHSAGVITTALGTVFIVEESTSSITHVKLLEGSVEVKPTKYKEQHQITHVLMPNEEIELDHKKAKILHSIKSPISATERGGYFKETAKEIVFKNVALDEVFLILKQNYAINIRYNKEQIKQKFYTGSFNQEPNAYQKILNEIQYLHEIELEIY